MKFLNVTLPITLPIFMMGACSAFALDNIIRHDYFGTIYQCAFVAINFVIYKYNTKEVIQK